MDIAIITIGNPGAGKSHFLNTILKRERFVHRISARPVTNDAECEVMDNVDELKDVKHQNSRLILWNMPGMMEIGGTNVERNREALNRAIHSAPVQVFVFIACLNNGRLRYEDIALFKQVAHLYQLSPESTIVLFNGCESSHFSRCRCVFQQVTEFTELKFSSALKKVSSINNFDSSISKFNSTLFFHFLSQCLPKVHFKVDDGILQIQDLQFYKRQIASIDNMISSSRQLHETKLGEFEQKQNELERLIMDTLSRHTQILKTYEEETLRILLVSKENDKIHETNLSSLEHCINENKKFEQSCRNMQNDAAANARRARKQKRIDRQIGASVKHLIHHPLKIIPIVAAAALGPIAPVAISATLGIGMTAASATFGAAIGAASAIAEKKNILLGALCGGITSGIPAATITSSTSVINAASIRASVVATTAVVTRQNPLAAVAGSLTQSFISEHGITNSIILNTSGQVASSIVTDPKNPFNRVGSTIVDACIGETTTVATTALSMKLPSNTLPLAVHSVDLKDTVTTFKIEQFNMKKTSNDIQHDIVHVEKSHLYTASIDPITSDVHTTSYSHSTRNSKKSRSKIVTSKKGISITAPNGAYVSPGSIGFSVPFGNDKTSTRHAISASDVYPGGINYITSISTESLPIDEGSTIRHSVQPIASRIIHEDVGGCFANRTTEHKILNSAGSVTQTISKEHHFNTEGCLGNPARALVGSAVIMLAPQITLPSLIGTVVVSNF